VRQSRAGLGLSCCCVRWHSKEGDFTELANKDCVQHWLWVVNGMGFSGAHRQRRSDSESFVNHQHETSPVAPGLWAVQTVQRARRASALETSADPQT
jgi:hypothetical protein